MRKIDIKVGGTYRGRSPGIRRVTVLQPSRSSRRTIVGWELASAPQDRKYRGGKMNLANFADWAIAEEQEKADNIEWNPGRDILPLVGSQRGGP